MGMGCTFLVQQQLPVRNPVPSSDALVAFSNAFFPATRECGCTVCAIDTERITQLCPLRHTEVWNPVGSALQPRVTYHHMRSGAHEFADMRAVWIIEFESRLGELWVRR